MSVDGFVAGPNDGVGRGLGDGGERLHEWANGGRWSYDGGTRLTPMGVDKQVLDEAFASAGAIVMGRRVFDYTEGWGGEPPFGVPCFVVTHRPRKTVVNGDTTFTFVTDGVASAVARAGSAAGDKDVRVMGGAMTVQQALAADIVDELVLHVAPVLLGGGKRLFDGARMIRTDLELTRVLQSPYALHLRYRLVEL